MTPVSRMKNFFPCLLILGAAASVCGASWKDNSMRVVLRNGAMEASFQAGQMYQLKDVVTGDILLHSDPASLPSKLPVFGSSSIDLETCRVKQSVSGSRLSVRCASPDGSVLYVTWKMQPGKGDLIFNASLASRRPIEETRAFFLGADILNRQMVWIHGYGTANVTHAPFQGPILLGNPLTDGSPSGFTHPLVALFEGKDSGWFIEGREPRVGPASLMISGTGDKANLGMVRKFPFPKRKADMYEVRIRTYKGHWEDAVDPYVNWLEKGAGFVALDKLPKQQAWVNGLKTQAYIGVGDYAGLEELAKRVDPGTTFVGRQGEFRYHAFDIGYPDYRVPESAAKWARRARELGFHVGMHFNIGSCSAMFPDLVERFRPGMQPTGKDADGNETYEHIYSGPNALYRVSAALEAWRDYLEDQIKHAVDAGIDVIYLDESMTPHGKFVVGNMDGYQGAFLLMRKILKKYPHVAIETEQFNPLTAKYGKIALSQMPLGHPLSGYIFRKFVKVVPEGVMYSPTDSSLMDAFDSWGFMLPGANVGREESWMRIAEAFHSYNLVPDSRLPRQRFSEYSNHYTSGLIPVDGNPTPKGGKKLFGFRGRNGVTAYLEKHPTKRGLVVYEPGQPPKWFGTRYSDIRTYSGPGLPSYFGFRQHITDWLVYDDKQLLGFNPRETYWFDPSVRPSPERFHVCKVPDDFAGVSDMETRTGAQEAGTDDAYFCLKFTGHGELGVYVPRDYEAYLDGQKLQVDPSTREASVTISASLSKAESLNYHIQLKDDAPDTQVADEGRPATLLAFRRTDTELAGDWTKLPWYGSPDSLKWIKGNSSNGFEMAIGATGRIIGRLPSARSVRIQGSYKISQQGTGALGDGIVRINGVEVLRIPYGQPPYEERLFDVDISRYAGEYVIVEFKPDGPVRGAAAEWNNPRFVAED